MLNPKYIQVFNEVARTGNLTQAAANLNMAPPSVSRFISLFEEETNSKLFVRSRSGMTLTGKGRVLYNYVYRSQNLISQAETALGLSNDDPEKTISIGFANMFFEPFIIPGIEHMETHLKDGNMKFSSVGLSGMIPLLQDRQIDIIIHTELFGSFPKVRTINIGKISNTICAPASFSHLRGRKVLLKELKNEKTALLGNLTAGSEFYQRYLLSHNMVLNPKYTLNAYSHMNGILSHGLAICIGPRLTMKEAIESGQAFELEMDYKIPDMDVCCYLNSEVRPTEATRIMLDYFTSHKISG